MVGDVSGPETATAVEMETADVMSVQFNRLVLALDEFRLCSGQFLQFMFPAWSW